jgi:hypothetical protein
VSALERYLIRYYMVFGLLHVVFGLLHVVFGGLLESITLEHI